MLNNSNKVSKCVSYCIAKQCASSINTCRNLAKSLWGLNTTQVCHMSKVKTRFTMPPFWQPKPTRVQYPENITRDNEAFLKEQILEVYSSPLKQEIHELGTWTPNSFRCGVIAKKLGCTLLWDKRDGKKTVATMLEVSDNHIIRYIPPEEVEDHDFRYRKRAQKHKLGCLIVGADSMDPRFFTKEYFNLFCEAGVMPKKRMTKFYITPNAKLSAGTPLYAAHYRPGQFIDCHGITVDRGFQGVMVRWKFKGMPASHGVTKSHRRGGNIGGGGEKGRVWPGKKMPGHMGRQSRVMRALKILRVNTKNNVLYIKGSSIPGEVGKYIIVYDSISYWRRHTEENPPAFPTFFPPQNGEELQEDLYSESIHPFNSPSITFPDDDDGNK